MKYFIRKQDSLPDYLERICLDSPSFENCAYEGERFYISGWILARKPGVQIFLENSTGENFELSLNRLRPDVLRKVKKIDGTAIGEEDSKIGFLHSFTLSGDFSIYVVHEKNRFLWVKANASIDQSIVDFWSKRNFQKKIDPSFKKEIIDNLVIHNGFSKKVVDRTFGINNWEKCNNFFNESSTLSGYVNFIKKIESGKFPFIIDSAGSKVVGSFVSAQYNYINIVEENVEYFYIQYVSSIDAVFFPRTNDFVIVGGHAGVHAVSRLLDVLHLYLPFDINKTLKLGGYLYGFDRPYHFLYDQFPVINFLLKFNYINKKRRFFVGKNHTFINLKDIHDDINDEVFHDENELNFINRNDDTFLFKLGINFQRGAVNPEKVLLINSGDNDLVHSAGKKYSATEDFFALRESGFKLWIGITGQKRSWIEQVKGSIKIIEYIAGRYENTCVLIDGWTSVKHDNPLDVLEAENDMRIFREIVSGVRAEVKFFNLIGQDILSKIYAASQVDFFVSNALTGSINVARVCAKPGVSHFSNVTRNIVLKDHFHPYTFLPDSSLISDIPDKENDRMDFYSYSIDPDAFLEFFKTSLKSAQANDFSLATSYRDILN